MDGLLHGNNYYYNFNTEADWARDGTVPREQVPLCVGCVWELPRQASCTPLYLSRVLERDWCRLKLCRPARWPLMGTVLILSKCTLLLLWTARGDGGQEERKNRTRKRSRREKDKKKTWRRRTGKQINKSQRARLARWAEAEYSSRRVIISELVCKRKWVAYEGETCASHTYTQGCTEIHKTKLKIGVVYIETM